MYKWLIPQLEQGNYKMGLECTTVPKRKCSKKDRRILKEKEVNLKDFPMAKGRTT